MKIIKSLRKTMSLKVDETWKLIVSAPFFISKEKIEEFIEKNKEWIENKKSEVMETIKKFTENEKFYFFWQEYELLFDNENENIYYDGMNFFLHKKHKNNVKEKFLSFYKKEARKYIENRLKEISSINDIPFNKLRITSAKTRWWSCTSAKNLNFSFRLIMSPVKTIDYVIVHEIAHLTYMNHSKNFWWLVDSMYRKIYPLDYKIEKKWLKDNWNKLMYL